MRYPLKKKYIAIAVVGGLAAWLLSADPIIGIAIFAVLFTPVWFGVYVKYAADNPQRLWFKRKLYGWGWTPVTWQGWLTTIGFVFTIVLLATTMGDNVTTQAELIRFWIIFAVLAAAFIFIACKKGEKPRWQWGDDGK